MATISARGKFLQLNWTDAQGKRHRESIGRADIYSKEELRQIIKAKDRELANLPAPRRVPTFSDYVSGYLLWHEHEYRSSHFRVAQIVADHLLPVFEFVPLDMIDPARVEQYKRDRGALAAVGTVTKELRTLQAIINRAVRDRVIDRNPIEYVSAPRDLVSQPHKWYTADELTKLYEATVEAWHAPAWKLFANSGLRRSEGLQLRWQDVGRDGLRILSLEDARTKSGHWRDVPLSVGAQEALGGLRGRDTTYVLPRIDPHSLSRSYARSAARAKIGGSLHTLRHTYISHLVMQGVPLRTVQIYAGHAHYTTTEGYAYLMPAETPAQVTGLSL